MPPPPRPLDYSCAQVDVGKMIYHGRLYISQNYICFTSNIFKWNVVRRRRGGGRGLGRAGFPEVAWRLSAFRKEAEIWDFLRGVCLVSDKRKGRWVNRTRFPGSGFAIFLKICRRGGVRAFFAVGVWSMIGEWNMGWTTRFPLE